MTRRSHTLLGIALLLCSAWAAASSLPKGVIELEPRPAPPLRLADFDGNHYDLAQAHGRWSFVHFWASWCGPCRREMPAIQRMVNTMQDTDLEIVLINTAEDEETVFTFLAGVAPDLTTLMDYDGLATEQWRPRGLPSTYLVDPKGAIRYVVLGGRPWDEPAYLQFLHRLLGTD